MFGLYSFERRFTYMSFNKKILVGKTITPSCKNALEKMGYDVVLLPPFSKMQKGVSTHADMLLFYDGKKIITSNEYWRENKNLFDFLDVETITTNEPMEKEYPNDILFNAVLTSDKILFSKNAYTSFYIKSIAKKQVNVNQGYTACSTCRVSDKAFITTDVGLHKAYIDNGIGSILISNEGIDLPGYSSCGFIGGATVVLDEYVCFFGKIENHPEYTKIKSFVEANNKKVHSLSQEKLTDIGGAVVLF